MSLAMSRIRAYGIVSSSPSIIRLKLPSNENPEPNATSIIWMEFEMGPIKAYGKEITL
jgi:hypothetical protein